MAKKIGLDAAAAAEVQTEVKAAATEQPQETKYTKAALAGSKRFQARRDLLNAILDDGVEYTINEVETIINNYLNKEV
jgi:hypothetical protein